MELSGLCKILSLATAGGRAFQIPTSRAGVGRPGTAGFFAAIIRCAWASTRQLSYDCGQRKTVVAGFSPRYIRSRTMKIRSAGIVLAILIVAAADLFSRTTPSPQIRFGQARQPDGFADQTRLDQPPRPSVYRRKRCGWQSRELEIELGPPAILLRNGWTKNSVKAGDILVVAGSLAKMARTSPMRGT